MDTQEIKALYIAPVAEVFEMSRVLSLLVSASIEAGIEDWEIGDEL